MTYITAAFLGLVQGIAEFLPISSSGHLSVLQNFMNLTDVEHDHIFFDVLLHFGTLIAVCIVYRKDIIDMIREFFLGIGSVVSRKGDRLAPPPPARPGPAGERRRGSRRLGCRWLPGRRRAPLPAPPRPHIR